MSPKRSQKVTKDIQQENRQTIYGKANQNAQQTLKFTRGNLKSANKSSTEKTIYIQPNGQN